MIETDPMTEDDKNEAYAMDGLFGAPGADRPEHEGDTPVKLFYKNYCTTAMHSLNTERRVSECVWRVRRTSWTRQNQMQPVKSIAPGPVTRCQELTKARCRWTMYYPKRVGGNRVPSVCDPDGTSNLQMSAN